MNEFVELIKSRRSIRGYLPKQIPKEILSDIIDAARMAPSANNIQPWEFIVITDKDKLAKIAELATWGKFIKDAAAAVIVCGEKENPHLLEDCSAATENILLAAKAYKIGSCWVAGYKRQYSEKIKELLKIPPEQEIVSIISLGYYYANPEPPNKRPLDKVLHWEKY
ncbi:MAG: nitroreductase family protein [Candidatus Woesearchaeota archaeon]